MISMYALRGAIELGLAYGLMAMGLFISYRIVNVADLTVDGSFTLGAAISAVTAAAGRPVLGLGLALAGGACAGFVTAFLQTRLRVQPILAGILVMTGLYSINLHVMGGRPNVSLLGTQTIFTRAAAALGEPMAKLALCAAFAAAAGALVVLFFKTQLGLTIRATGDNADMVRSSSINADLTTTIGLCMANAIVALSGALVGQMQMFADSSMGVGMVVIGLASIIIGEALCGRGSVARGVAAVVLGSVVYRVIIAFVLELGLPQSDLKLISSVIVALAISYPVAAARWALYRRRRAEKGKKEGKVRA